MRREMRTLLVGCVVVAVAVIATGGGGIAQLWNIARAGRHAVKVNRQLAAVPEFRDIRASEATSHGGALAIHGHLKSEAQFPRLKALAARTRPPVTVVYYVRVGDRRLK